MARIVVRCPICKATTSVDNKKRKVRCPLCHNSVFLEACEVVVPPEENNEYHGKWFNNHLFLGYFTLIFGMFGLDLFIKKRIQKGFISLLLSITGASLVMAIFRGMEILALEDDQIKDYYINMR